MTSSFRKNFSPNRPVVSLDSRSVVQGKQPGGGGPGIALRVYSCLSCDLLTPTSNAHRSVNLQSTWPNNETESFLRTVSIVELDCTSSMVLRLSRHTCTGLFSSM